MGVCGNRLLARRFARGEPLKGELRARSSNEAMTFYQGAREPRGHDGAIMGGVGPAPEEKVEHPLE